MTTEPTRDVCATCNGGGVVGQRTGYLDETVAEACPDCDTEPSAVPSSVPDDLERAWGEYNLALTTWLKEWHPNMPAARAKVEAASRRPLVEALERALALAEAWRDVTDDTLGRTTAGGSAQLDYMHDEMDDLDVLLAAAKESSRE